MQTPKHAPSITLPAGYRFDVPHMADHVAVEALMNDYTRANYGREEVEPGSIKRAWESPNFDLESSVILIRDSANTIIGYGVVVDDYSPPVHPHCAVRLRSDHEDTALGNALLAWIENRARQAIDRCPPEARVSYRLGMKVGQTFYEPLFQANGLAPIRYWWTMRIDRPEDQVPPQLPEGISVRAMRYPDELPEVVRADRDSFSDHWGYVLTPFDEELKEWQHWTGSDPHFDPSLWFLAIDDATGEIAGISLCESRWHGDDTAGHVDTLGVRKAYRKRGLGLALLQHSFRELWARDKHYITLGVDASSLTGATRLYERAGMDVYRQGVTYEKELRGGVDLSTTALEE